jgi:hypothetical protein
MAASRRRGATGVRVEVGHYGVSDFADDYLGTEPGVNLSGVGPAGNEVAYATQSETHASPLIATVLWRAFLEGGGLDEFRSMYSEQLPASATVEELFVIRHPLRGGEPRHDLLLLVDGDVDPRGIFVNLQTPILEAGWERCRTELGAEAEPGSALSVLSRTPEPLFEASRAQSFGVIISRVPEMILTSVPSPAVAFRSGDDDESNFSTVGLLVERGDGARGVTAALHALNGGTTSPDMEIAVGPVRGVVRSVDPISDSCFIEVDDIDQIARAVLSGVLMGVTPRNYAETRFDGGTSGQTRTFITGWSPELPVLTPRMQLRVLTEPDTVPGDSGAALIDDDDRVLGLAFERTGYDQRPSFSSWIWAEAVLRAHDLRLLA